MASSQIYGGVTLNPGFLNFYFLHVLEQFFHVAGASFTPLELKEELREQQAFTLSGTNHKKETKPTVVYYSVPCNMVFLERKKKIKEGIEELQGKKWDYSCTPESWYELLTVMLTPCTHFCEHKAQKYSETLNTSKNSTDII